MEIAVCVNSFYFFTAQCELCLRSSHVIQVLDLAALLRFYSDPCDVMLFCHRMFYTSNAYNQLVSILFNNRYMLFLCSICRVRYQFSHLLTAAHYRNALVLYKSYDVLTMFTNEKSHVSYLLKMISMILMPGLMLAGLPDCRIAGLLCSDPLFGLFAALRIARIYFTFLVYFNYTQLLHKVKHFLKTFFNILLQSAYSPSIT